MPSVNRTQDEIPADKRRTDSGVDPKPSPSSGETIHLLDLDEYSWLLLGNSSLSSAFWQTPDGIVPKPTYIWNCS